MRGPRPIRNSPLILWSIVFSLGLSCHRELRNDQIWDGETLGQLAVPLVAHRHLLNAREAPLGNLVSDALLEEARRVFPGTAAAVIRGRLLGYDEIRIPAGIYPAGPFRAEMAKDIFRFREPFFVGEVSGARLQTLFEQALKLYPRDSPVFLQVSRGMRVELREAAAGRQVAVRIDGRLVDAQARYLVASPNLGVWGDEQPLLVGSMIEALEAYVTRHGSVAPAVEGRVLGPFGL